VAGCCECGDEPSGSCATELVSVSRPALRPTQHPIQWVLGVLSPMVKRSPGVTLTTHPHLVPRSRMGRSYSSSTLAACIAVVRQLYFYFYAGEVHESLESIFH
jgi:hypothetical protein